MSYIISSHIISSYQIRNEGPLECALRVLNHFWTSLWHDQAEFAHSLKRHWMHPRPGPANNWPEIIAWLRSYMMSYMISYKIMWWHSMISYSLYDIMYYVWYHFMIWYHFIILSFYDIMISNYGIIPNKWCDITHTY